MEHNSDFKYDLDLGLIGESFVASLFGNRTLEVKFDFEAYRTGNFYIEYMSRGRISGIAKTEADYWILIAATEKGGRHKESIAALEPDDVLYAIMISTPRLKKLCKTAYHRRDVPGGDSNTSIGVLIKSKVLLENE